MIIPCGHQKNGDQEAEGEMIHSTLSPHNSSSDARISAQKNGDASVRSNLYCYNPKSVRSDPSGAEEEAEEDGEEEECVDDNVTDLDLKLPSTIIKNDQRNVSGLFMARSGEPSDIPRDRIHRIKDDWLDLRLGIGSHEDSSNRFTGMIDNSCRLDVFDASINGTPESAGLCTLQLLPQIHTDQSESPLQLGNLRSKPIINENMKSCGGINRKDLDQDIDLLTGRLNRNSDYTFLDHRNSIREQFLGAVPPTVNVSMLLQGGHSKASAAISALPFHFNRRSAEIQKWPASDQIKALGDNEGSMMIKNSIENPNDAYESSLIQPDLIIRSSKGRLISHQDYTSNNASANHRNHRSMNPSMPLWTQTAIQSNDAPAIGLLSPFDSRVISPDAINTTSRTRAVSGFWFSLQPDDPNHLSQEEVPKPYLRIRYSLDKNVCHSDFFMYVIFNLCANVKQPAIKQWFTQSESFMYVN